MKRLACCCIAGFAVFLWSAPPARAGSVEAGLEWISFHYEEAGFMREDGFLYGTYATYTSHRGRLLNRSTVLCAFGTVRYDGALTDNTPWQADSDDTLVDVRFTSGYRNGTNSTTVTPYTGIAGRYLLDDLPPPYGYLRQQWYLYAPLGITVETAAGPRVTLGATVEYDWFLNGRNYSGGSYFTQHAGYGLRCSVSLDYRAPNGHWSVLFEPFVRYWYVDNSTVSADGWYEPQNTTVSYGVRAGVLF
jgi:hypothetical protein